MPYGKAREGQEAVSTKSDKARKAAERLVCTHVPPVDYHFIPRLTNAVARAIRAGYKRGKSDGRRSAPPCFCDCVKLEDVVKAAKAFHDTALVTVPGCDVYRRGLENLSDALAALEEK
jgi:hypothetical protein